jgi:hypothetical protein
MFTRKKLTFGENPILSKLNCKSMSPRTFTHKKSLGEETLPTRKDKFECSPSSLLIQYESFVIDFQINQFSPDQEHQQFNTRTT